jgi:hypothetical protein
VKVSSRGLTQALQLQYGAAEARAPSAAIVRPVLLLVGILHALCAAAAVMPGVLVWLFRLDVRRWSFLFPQPAEAIVAATSMCCASLVFAAICIAALARPAGRATTWVRIAAFAYIGVWLVDGLFSGILPVVAQAIRGRTPPTWINYLASVGSSVCREAGQVSLLLLIHYAFGRRSPTDSRLLRAVPFAAIGVCGAQVLMRVFQTVESYASRYTSLPWERRVSFLLRDDVLHRFWTVGASYLLVCLLALGTFRRRPRLAGTLILLPFLVVEPIARGTLWTAFNVNSVVERVMTLAYDLSFLVFSATTPIAAFVLFTILGRRLTAHDEVNFAERSPPPESPPAAHR